MSPKGIRGGPGEESVHAPDLSFSLFSYLWIDRRPPTANAWVGATSPWRYIAIKRIWLKEVPPCAQKCRILKGPIYLQAIRWLAKGERRYDPDNFSGGLKPIIDALRKHLYIHSDAASSMTLQVAQVRPGPDRQPPGLHQPPGLELLIWGKSARDPRIRIP